jgi:hypothetical protein
LLRKNRSSLPGLEVVLTANPAVETAGYFQSPLGGWKRQSKIALDKTANCGVLLGMSKKPILMILLVLVVTLTMVSVISTPLPKTKKHGTRIQSVNSISGFSFTLTNNPTPDNLSGAKP